VKTSEDRIFKQLFSRFRAFAASRKTIIFGMVGGLLVVFCIWLLTESPSDSIDSTPTLTLTLPIGTEAPTAIFSPTRELRPTHTAVPPPRPTNTSQPTVTPRPSPTASPALLNVTPPPPVGICDCSGDIYDCEDIAMISFAQECYDYCMESGAGDVHGFDEDNDGVICEN
jgi:hypothetical protein